MIREHGFDTVCGNLGKWLNETSELGCGDDITVVMVYIDEDPNSSENPKVIPVEEK